MAKLKGKAKQEFLDRMAKGRAKKGGGGRESSGVGSAMVPYTAMPLVGASFVGSSPSAPKKSVRQRLTNVLELAAKKQSLFTSAGAGGVLAYADHENWLQELPELDAKSGLDNKFTLAAGAYFLADSDFLASMPRIRLFVQDIANVSVGIGSYNAVRIYLANRDKGGKKSDEKPVEGIGWRHREEF